MSSNIPVVTFETIVASFTVAVMEIVWWFDLAFRNTDKSPPPPTTTATAPSSSTTILKPGRGKTHAWFMLNQRCGNCPPPCFFESSCFSREVKKYKKNNGNLSAIVEEAEEEEEEVVFLEDVEMEDVKEEEKGDSSILTCTKKVRFDLTRNTVRTHVLPPRDAPLLSTRAFFKKKQVCHLPAAPAAPRKPVQCKAYRDSCLIFPMELLYRNEPEADETPEDEDEEQNNNEEEKNEEGGEGEIEESNDEEIDLLNCVMHYESEISSDVPVSSPPVTSIPPPVLRRSARLEAKRRRQFPRRSERLAKKAKVKYPK